jgi:hypothetical protein
VGTNARLGGLDEQAGPTLAECCGLCEKRVEQVLRRYQALHMGDPLRHFDRKAEIVRHARGPSQISRRPVLPVKRRIDLGSTEDLGIASET